MTSVQPAGFQHAVRATPSVRVEYRGFHDTDDAREYLLVAMVKEGSCEVRFWIAHGAFSPGPIRIQDGPDVCYQKLTHEIASGEAVFSGPSRIGIVELEAYRVARMPPPRRSRVVPAA